MQAQEEDLAGVKRDRPVHQDPSGDLDLTGEGDWQEKGHGKDQEVQGQGLDAVSYRSVICEQR